MNRQFLFRGKSNGSNHKKDTIVYGGVFQCKTSGKSFIIADTWQVMDKKVEVYPDSIQQYTGIDIDNEKIFEGDVLKGLFYGYQGIGEVRFDKENACFSIFGNFGDIKYQSFDNIIYNDFFKYLKKIDNRK